MSRQILDQHISKQKDGTYHARVELVEDDGERGSLSDNFATFEEANQYVTAVENGLDILPDGTIPEPANMTPEQAKVINSNVNPAPAPNGATRIPNGDQTGAADQTETAADTQQPPTDTDTSNEVAGAQDPNAEPSSSAQQSDQTGQGSNDTSTSDTTDNSKESKSDAGSSKKGKSSKSN